MRASQVFQRHWSTAWINALHRSSKIDGPNDAITITALTTADYKLLCKHKADIRLAISAARDRKGLYNPERWTLRLMDGEAEAVTEAQIVG